MKDASLYLELELGREDNFIFVVKMISPAPVDIVRTEVFCNAPNLYFTVGSMRGWVVLA